MEKPICSNAVGRGLHPSAPMVELWRVEHERVTAECLEQFIDWLTPEERARQLRYRRPQDQKRYAVGRGLLRSLLEHYTGRPAREWRFRLGEYGRPELSDEQACDPSVPQFNLSHSWGVSVAAFGRGVLRLGADVEVRDRSNHWNLARRFFAPSEAVTVEEADPENKGELFLRYWTLKEAYVKAVGQGITLGLDTFAFQLSDQEPPRVAFTRPEIHSRPDGWHFFELPSDGERVAVAIECDERPTLDVKTFVTRLAAQ